ncbi:alpha/beta hydrolase family protein [Pseudoalteromonas sp. SCSIO 43210]
MVSAQFLKSILNVLLICTLFLSIQVTAAEHIAPPTLSSIENNDIERLLPNDEIKSILAGETEFLSLYSEYMSADFRGVVLLIPDWQSVPTNNAGMSFLRKELNNLGYTTYAMTVPDIDWQASKIPDSSTEMPAETTTPDAATSTEPATADMKKNAEPHYVNALEKVTNEVLDNYKINLIARFNALYQTAMQEPGNVVVIAQGTSAGVLLEHYADFPEQRVDAFISLSSYLPNTKRNKDLSQTTSLVTPALLDIYYANDSNDILMGLKNRQRWVNRNAKFDYRQRQLFGLRDQPDQHARLTKEIDGFLRRLF